MIRKIIAVMISHFLIAGSVSAQTFIKTSDLFQEKVSNNPSGQLNINQNPSLDTLLSRYILANSNLAKENLHSGMWGFRIQIYGSNNRNAREESNKSRADFMGKFPDIVSYPIYAKPGYYKIRVGDFRTKTEAIKLFLAISREFPDAYIVPDFINFPDLIKK